MALAVVKDGVFAVTELALLQDALVQLLKVVLRKTIVLKELLYFIVNIFG